VKDTDLAVRILDREISESKIDIKGASVIVAGGYGMGSKVELRSGVRACRRAGRRGGSPVAPPWTPALPTMPVRWARPALRSVPNSTSPAVFRVRSSIRRVWTVRLIISINTDPEAPINKIADYAITGDVNEIIPKMIKYYKQNSK